MSLLQSVVSSENGKAILTIKILSFNICEIRSWENLSVVISVNTNYKYRLVMDQPETNVVL
jgi:hypothetical protein